ncbi:MAG: lamin tail domain-containing protein [Candidatus Peribacteraceae bacterium]|nr:lamin tail domain-containing protein [Candidatus Peribacteraceae bacterium]
MLLCVAGEGWHVSAESGAVMDTSPQADVVISEVMWMGSDLSTADEWVEIAGRGTGTADLAGWTLTSLKGTGEEGVLYAFGAGDAIAAGDVRVISNFPAASSRLEAEPWRTTSAMSLPNTKLLLRLRDSAGTVRDEVDDGVGAPFAGSNPTGTGARASMERIDLSLTGTIKENWRTAVVSSGFKSGVPIFGTPGSPSSDVSPSSSSPSSSSASFASSASSESSSSSQSSSSSSPLPSSSSFSSSLSSFPSVLITEVLANPLGADDEEWIEVGNLGAETADIAGWTLDDGNSPAVYVIPPRGGSGFFLAPGEHVSFRKSVTKLALDNAGERVSLMSGATLVDAWTYAETAEEVSFGRDPASPVLLRPFCVPTEGAPNTLVALDPKIVIQSGDTEGRSPLSLNLTAEVARGSLASATCAWDFGDGATGTSCNPPSHAFTQEGLRVVRLTVHDFCAGTAERTLTVTVLPEETEEAEDRASSVAAHCVPDFFESGIVVSEFLPDPEEDEAAGEWIELQNRTWRMAALCGWTLDDGEGGSSPFKLDFARIVPQGFLVLSRGTTGLALNNGDDHVRLFGPGGFLAEDVSYEDAEEGESYALCEDGTRAWTPLLTPDAPNEFSAEASSASALSSSSALSSNHSSGPVKAKVSRPAKTAGKKAKSSSSSSSRKPSGKVKYVTHLPAPETGTSMTVIPEGLESLVVTGGTFEPRTSAAALSWMTEYLLLGGGSLVGGVMLLVRRRW